MRKNIYQKNDFINVMAIQNNVLKLFWGETLLLCTPTLNGPLTLVQN
jgi:hypothetical protein